MPAAFSRLLGWLATVVIFLAGLFFAVLALGGHLQLLEARKVMAQGQPVEGTVTGLRRGTGKSASYYFSYEFSAGGATHAKKDAGISYGDFQELRQGRKISVRYDPAHPAHSITAPEMAEFESIPNRLFLPGVALLLLGWWVARLVRRRPAPPASPASSDTPEPTRYVSPVRRGE
jgi:uncharacterized protein DUF3592